MMNVFRDDNGYYLAFNYGDSDCCVANKLKIYTEELRYNLINLGGQLIKKHFRTNGEIYFINKEDAEKALEQIVAKYIFSFLE